MLKRVCDELAFCPVFTSRPTPEYLTRWREHIEATGHPETFDDVTSAGRRVDGDVVVLSEEITVPVERRSGSARVPCPLCTPGHEKFVHGRMVWFVDEKVVRFVGHECARTRLGDTYVEADKRYSHEALLAGYLRRWHELLPMQSDLMGLLSQMFRPALHLGSIREQINQCAPGFTGFLARELSRNGGMIEVEEDTGRKDKSGTPIWKERELGRVQGLTLLQSDFDPYSLQRKLVAIVKNAGHPPTWSSDMAGGYYRNDAESVLLSTGKAIYSLPKKLVDLAASLADAQQFLKKDNLALLERYGTEYADKSPFRSLLIGIKDGHLEARCHSYAGDHYVHVKIPDDALTEIPAVPAVIQAMALNSLRHRK